MKNPHEDIPLSDGQGYMVGKKDFDAYLQVTSAAPENTTEVRIAHCPKLHSL